MMKWKGYGRKWYCPVLWQYYRIYVSNLGECRNILVMVANPRDESQTRNLSSGRQARIDL